MERELEQKLHAALDTTFEQIVATFSRYIDAEQCGVGRFVQTLIGAGRLADDMGLSLNIENVVPNLKGNADVAGECVKCIEFFPRQIVGQQAGGHHRRMN